MPLLELRILEIHCFLRFPLHALTYWAEICILVLFCFTVLQIKFECRIFASIFVGVMPLLELRILKIHSLPYFSLTCYEIMSWNFEYIFVLLYYRSSLSLVNLCQFVWELCPFWNIEYWKYSFPLFSLTCFDILSWNFAHDFFTALHIKVEWSQFASIFVGVMPLLELRILEIHRFFLHFSLVFTCFDILSW